MRTVKGINKLNAVIDWELFRTDLESLLGYDARDARKSGRPPFDPVLMLKVLVLQKYHGLSDDETEFQILDRFSFMQFLSLQAGDSVPDAKTIWDFKQLLEKDGRDGGRKLFERFGQLLQAQGLLAKEGSIVDASFVAAPRQRNSREQHAQIKQGQRPKHLIRRHRGDAKRIARLVGQRRTTRCTTVTKITRKWMRKVSWSVATRRRQRACMIRKCSMN